VQEVALDAGGREAGVVCFQEHHAHNVVADVTLTLQLQHYSKYKLFVIIA
jgi:hypothetical protein